MTPQQIAEAFSGHEFEKVYEFLADDIHWNNINGPQYTSKDRVVAACTEASDYFRTVTTVFKSLRSHVGEGHVVVETLSDYAEDGVVTPTVASCDIYEFADDQVTAITSYNVEVEPAVDDSAEQAQTGAADNNQA